MFALALLAIASTLALIALFTGVAGVRLALWVARRPGRCITVAAVLSGVVVGSWAFLLVSAATGIPL